MLETTPVTGGLKPGGTITVNGRKSPEYYLKLLGDQFGIFVLDAGAVAAAHNLGSAANPIVNTAILGAFARATGLVRIESVEQAIETYVPVKKDANKQAARDAYLAVVRAGSSAQ